MGVGVGVGVGVGLGVGVGDGGIPFAVIEKSSIANPSSELEASTSVHLIQKVAPAGILSPVILELRRT